jgi:hypothetical protein
MASDQNHMAVCQLPASGHRHPATGIWKTIKDQDTGESRRSLIAAGVEIGARREGVRISKAIYYAL